MSELILNGNGRAPSRKGKDLATRDEAAAMAEEIAVKIAEHYHGQVPDIVQAVCSLVVPKLVADMLAAHGITLAAPPKADGAPNVPTDSEGAE